MAKLNKELFIKSESEKIHKVISEDIEKNGITANVCEVDMLRYECEIVNKISYTKTTHYKLSEFRKAVNNLKYGMYSFLRIPQIVKYLTKLIDKL